MNSLQYRQLAKRIDELEKRLIDDLGPRLTELEAALAPKPRKETLTLPKKANSA